MQPNCCRSRIWRCTAKKRDGKNGAQIFDNSMLDSARARAEIESHIENGLAEDWFDAYLQPIVGLDDHRIAGFEALLRLDHPQKGLMPPAGIIHVAEETAKIVRVGNVIMEKAIGHLANISRIPGMQDTYLAINFSPLQFEVALPSASPGSSGGYGIRPDRIVVEITEAVLMHDNPQIRMVLTELRRFGCRIALDDFGTGYSSLSYLNRFPVDIIKVDQSFTRSINDTNDDVRHKSRMLIEGITTLSHKMDCTVIAEGIETEEECRTLHQMGLDYGQGYLFHRPQNASKLIEDLTAVVNAGQPKPRDRRIEGGKMKKLLLLAFLTLPCAAPAQSQTVSFTTEEYAPFNYRDGKVIKGATVEQVEKVMADIGVDYTMEMLPWARAYSLAQSQPMTCVFATAHNALRDPLFKWIEPLLQSIAIS